MNEQQHVPGAGPCFTTADRLILDTWTARNKRYRRYTYPIVQTDEGREHVGITSGHPGNECPWQIVKEPDGYAMVEWPAIQRAGTFATMEEALAAIPAVVRKAA